MDLDLLRIRIVERERYYERMMGVDARRRASYYEPTLEARKRRIYREDTELMRACLAALRQGAA